MMRAPLISFALVLALPIAAGATTYNAVTGFTSSANPNGVFSYGYGTPGSTFSLDLNSGTAYAGIAGDQYRTGGAPGSIAPLVAINPSGDRYATARLPSDDLWMHPGDADDLASIVQFTAPTSGLYALDGLWERLDDGGGNGVFVSIYEGSTALLAPTYIENVDGTTVNFALSTYLTAGESVDFDLARNGQYNDDSTGLQLLISTGGATPEPSSFVLLGTGILGLAGAARRKLRS